MVNHCHHKSPQLELCHCTQTGSRT